MCSKVFGLILLVCFGVCSIRTENDKLDETFYNKCENLTEDLHSRVVKLLKDSMPIYIKALIPCYKCLALSIESIGEYEPVKVTLSSDDTYLQTTTVNVSRLWFSCNCSMSLNYEEFSHEIDNMTEGASSHKCDDQPEKLEAEEKDKKEIESVEKINVKKCEKHLKSKLEGRVSGSIKGYVDDIAVSTVFEALSGENISHFIDYNVFKPGTLGKLECQGDDDFLTICECCREAGVFDVVISHFIKVFLICLDDPLKSQEADADYYVSCYKYIKNN